MFIQGRENDRNRMKEKLESRVREVLPPPRQVTAVLKCRLVADKTTVILTIWGANDDSSFDIKEGDTITVYNCFAMGTRYVIKVGHPFLQTQGNQSYIRFNFYNLR